VATSFLPLIAAALAFICVAGFGFAFAGGGAGNTRTAKRAQAIAAGNRLERQARLGKASNDPASRRKAILKSLKDQEKQQRKVTLSIEGRLKQADLPITVKTFWIISLVVGLVAAVIGLLLRQPLVALGMGFAAGLGLPRWVVNFLGQRRTKKFTANFSDALDVIVRGIKSGLPVHDALKMIARESPEPLGSEFNRLVENIGMGMAMDQALDKMYENMPTSELKFFQIVMAIQQKTGGNLAEALGNLSNVIRARKLMREKIKALSSEATASAFIIGCLPPGVVTLIMVSSPEYMSVMFTDPRGQLMLMGGVVWMGIGIFVMRKMINFKY